MFSNRFWVTYLAYLEEPTDWCGSVGSSNTHFVIFQTALIWISSSPLQDDEQPPLYELHIMDGSNNYDVKRGFQRNFERNSESS